MTDATTSRMQAMRHRHSVGSGTMRQVIAGLGDKEMDWAWRSASKAGLNVAEWTAQLIVDAYDEEHPEPVKAGEIDETIFPVGRFRGQWNEGDPPLWEVFDVCLFGNEAGDFIVCADQMQDTLKASGYRLTLEKINVTKGEQNNV
jgi:hypothetical protein